MPSFEHRADDLVAGVAMRVADRDRLVDLVAAAVLLARRRADPPEDARERDGPLEDPGRLPPAALGVGLEEARDVDVARALVLAGRQAVGVVVGEDQLEVRPPEAAHLLGLGLDHHPRLGRARARDGRVGLPLDLHDAHPARAETRQLGLVAQGRDLDPVVAADLEDRLALEPLDDPAVDLDPDPGRRLGTLRRLRRDQALGQRIVDRLDGAQVVGADDQVGHAVVSGERRRRWRSAGRRQPGRCCAGCGRPAPSGSIASRRGTEGSPAARGRTARSRPRRATGRP